jgi:hypothetical protein
MVAPADPLVEAASVLGLGLLSLLVAAVVAVAHRWYFKRRVPGGVTLLAGVSAVAIFLNTRGALEAVAQGEGGYLALEAVLFNSMAFLLAALFTPVGQRIGDRIARSSAAFSGAGEIEGDVSRFVTAVGRRTAVTLPERIEDIEGYDPVDQGVKETLADRTFLFPSRLSPTERRDRLVTRLKADYEIGYVDLDIQPDGTVDYLALGQRMAGLGPTLAPGDGAVAVTADPPNAASRGDVVQVWDVAGDSPERVATAEVRGVADEVVTLALDAQEARRLTGGDYRLLTLPTQPRPDRAFAGLLRSADETMATVEVDPEGDLVGTTVRELGATVVAIRPAGGTVQAIPPRSHTLEAGDLVYLVARPDVVRGLGAEGAGT